LWGSKNWFGFWKEKKILKQLKKNFGYESWALASTKTLSVGNCFKVIGSGVIKVLVWLCGWVMWF